jgi:hypothetical protein
MTFYEFIKIELFPLSPVFALFPILGPAVCAALTA